MVRRVLFGWHAVECALKASIAKLTQQHDFPNKDLALKSYTHKLEELIKAANLAPLLRSDMQVNIALGTNWSLTKDWDETSRYQRWSEFQARELFEAITNSQSGVLPWIAVHW